MCDTDSLSSNDHNKLAACASSDDDQKRQSSSLESSTTCSHPVVMKLICTTCGQNMSKFYGLPFDYITDGLRLSESEADGLRFLETNFVLSNKKLILVLDLDETLLHTTKILKPQEKYIENDIDSLRDIFKVEQGGFTRYAKLRPFVHNFLQETSTMFEMYVYTNSNRDYARKMIKFLDPGDRYFNSRVIAREDSTTLSQKNLDVVMGQERAIVILDDKDSVWPMHKDNLIQVLKYKYFALSDKELKSKSFAERKVDEKTSTMATYLEILKKIHSRFFYSQLEEENLAGRDVRDVMRTVRGEILQGCKIVIRSNLADKIKLDYLSDKAEKMGAVCVSEVDCTVTHVVKLKAKPVAVCDDQLRLGKKKKKKQHDKTYRLVHPEWIRDSYLLWHRMPFEDYLP